MPKIQILYNDNSERISYWEFSHICCWNTGILEETRREYSSLSDAVAWKKKKNPASYLSITPPRDQLRDAVIVQVKTVDGHRVVLGLFFFEVEV